MNTGIKSSLSESLAEAMRQEIRTGRHAPGALIGSEHDLARQHGVSRVTVRRATDRLIADGLIERRPGKGLYITGDQDRNHGVLQFVAGNLAWVPCLLAARAIQAQARGTGLRLQIYDAHGSYAEDLATLAGLPESGARGAVIMGLHAPAFAEALYGLKHAGFPFVLLDERLHDLEVSSVTADNHSGGYQVGQACCAHGHRRIAFIGNLGAETVQARLAGLRDAVGDAGLPFDRRLIADIVSDDPLAAWTPQVAQATRDLMAVDDPPTAIFASCDAIARDVMVTLAELGIRVGDEVSVVGFDDDPLAVQLATPLASVRQDFTAMGEIAFALVHEAMRNPGAGVERRVVPVQFIERASLRDCPAGRR